MTFEYQEVKTCTASIDVDDIGNCCILTRSVLGEERYLYINTQFGSTQIISYGPIVPDIDQLPSSCGYSYNRFDFNDRKIIKEIEKFISTAEYAEVIDVEYMKDNMRDFMDNMIVYNSNEDDGSDL